MIPPPRQTNKPSNGATVVQVAGEFGDDQVPDVGAHGNVIRVEDCLSRK